MPVLEPMDAGRLRRWIQVSGALSWCHPSLLMYVQGLGALDARLFLDEETCPFEDDAVWATPDLSVGLADRIVLCERRL